jgi:hypothetical protein
MLLTHRAMRLLYVFMVFATVSCGKLPYGTVPNDPVPTGSIVAQGVFTSSGTETVTGSAVVYSQGGGRFVVRLNNLDAYKEVGLQVRGVLDSGTILDIGGLRAYTGNQNYSITTTSGSGWSQVTIYSPRAVRDYGIALLQ